MRSDSFTKDNNGLVTPDGTRFFQAGYDPIMSTAALLPYEYPAQAANGTNLPEPKSPLVMSGPTGLTFDQSSRDPLIVNSLYYIEVDRKELTKWVDPTSLNDPSGDSPVPASHLYCQIRFRRTVRWGYDADGKTPKAGEDHPLASEWTASHWVKFLPDSDSLRPSDDSGVWTIVTGGQLSLKNWKAPQPWTLFKEGTCLAKQYTYLLCVTRDDLDAVGRPTTRFHSLYQIKSGRPNQLVRLAKAPDEQPLETATVPRLRGRIIEAPPLVARAGCHTFRATGITAYLLNGGTIEKAQAIAAHESPGTAKLYDRTNDDISLDEVERIVI